MSKEVENSDELLATFDINSIDITSNLSSVYQEGNYLVGTTEKGVKFRQRIPANKRLNMKGDKYVLETINI